LGHEQIYVHAVSSQQNTIPKVVQEMDQLTQSLLEFLPV